VTRRRADVIAMLTATAEEFAACLTQVWPGVPAVAELTASSRRES
jgi:hypothetical protein